jgi:hypothetical protein
MAAIEIAAFLRINLQERGEGGGRKVVERQVDVLR